MENDDKYVLRTDYLEDRSKIYKEINKVDKRHTDLHNDLRLLVTKLNENNKTLIDSQKVTNTTLEKINDNLSGFKDRISNVEYVSNDTVKRVETIEKNTAEKQKGTLEIWVALIAIVPGILGAAAAFAQLL